jgi:predicted hotdog family 3-hydroxylacyl-ACP dehydratase
MAGSLEPDSIENYVPHRGAMLLIDRLIVATDDYATAEVLVRSNGLFVRDGKVPAWVGIEYMAQTIAAWAGARAKKAEIPVKIGFLLGTRRYETSVPEFSCGEKLCIKVVCELIGENGLGMFNCQILSADQVIARAQVSVYEPENGVEFLKNEARSIARV